MTNEEWNQAKEAYQATEIPEELNDRVRSGIAQGRRHVARRHGLWRTVGTLAACFAVLIAGLNLSPTFAAAAAEIPVLGGFFQVLTVRSYTHDSGDITVQVSQPAISGGGALAEKVNAEIQKRVDEKTAEGQQLVAQTKDAFLSTGGTEAEWAQRDHKVSVTYDVKSQTDTTVSFVVDSYVSIASAYQQSDYYNLDIANNKELTLLDVLGSDWVEICNASIKEQMAKSEDPSVFFDESMDGFTTVDETTNFYINEAGNPVVVYPRATVAIGAMGQVEFEIAK